ncbi:MAG: hypothetical protein AB7T49_13225 [Oligoflexales bacterium]
MDLLRTRAVICLVILSMFGFAKPAIADDDEALFQNVEWMATDLVDEMVYAWKKTPIFSKATGLALAEISAPVGLDERFNVTVENRLYDVMRQNSDIPMYLVFCSLCTRYIVKSTPKGTIFSRGIDQPEAVESLVQQTPDQLALSMVFETEGRELVLRASIFELKSPQRLVWAQSFATSRSARRLLRETAPLISLEQARADQNALLEGKDPLEIDTRITVRQFKNNQVMPLMFVEQSFEGILLPDRNTRAAVTFGFTSIREALTGYSFGGHFSRLMFHKRPRLAVPDLYFFFGGHHVHLRGPQAAIFGQGQLDVARIIDEDKEPKVSLTTWRLGLETHVKYRFGFTFFLENIPLLKGNALIKQDSLLGIPYHAIGWGVLIRW